MTAPRLLVIMGSGETAPTMVTPHRDIVARFGAAPPKAVLLDTPYGFQENAAEVSQRAVEYFAQRVQLAIEVAGFPGPLAADPRERSDQPTPATLARLRAADLVFSGPGSPTYALSTWQGSSVPEAISDKLAHGGVAIFASAAAVTVGRFSLPVYEIYKVGHPIHWLDGLDLLSPLGFGANCIVVPHFDNAEGGTHDTRFCYMGERRLRTLEATLPEGAFVLGVDSHTALVLDLETGEASIAGLGGITVRVDGRSTRFGAGSALSIEAIGEAARALAAGDATEAVHDAALAGGPETRTTPAPPLRDSMANLEGTFVAALEHGETREAVAALLDLDSAISARLRQGEDSPDLDSASAMFRSLIVRLGDGAAAGAETQLIDELVGGLVEARDTARANRDFATADRIRDRLAAAGIEVRDGANGSTWVRDGVPGAAAATGPAAAAN